MEADANVMRAFEAAMRDVYRRAKDEADYHATYFLGMLADLGGLETARRLIRLSAVSDGFTALWERRRLDLSVEALVLREEFASLFTEDEREPAERRLRDYGWVPGTSGG